MDLARLEEGAAVCHVGTFKGGSCFFPVCVQSVFYNVQRYSSICLRDFSTLAMVGVFHVRKDLHRTETLEHSKHELMSNC